MENIVSADLVKLKTDDGLVEMKDHIQIGAQYNVDMNSKRMVKGFNIEKKILWEREVIDIVDSEGRWWMPTELLSIRLC